MCDKGLRKAGEALEGGFVADKVIRDLQAKLREAQRREAALEAALKSLGYNGSDGRWHAKGCHSGEPYWEGTDCASWCIEARAALSGGAERDAEAQRALKCPQCGRQLTGVEYAYNEPEHYDGVSEWACFPCGYHRGRWSGKLLGDGEKEPRYGRKREEAEGAQA